MSLPLRGINPYFLISQIAGRIRGPYLTIIGFSPGTKIPGADIQKTALGTPTLNILFLVLKFEQELIFWFGPYLREWFLKDIAKDMFSPELIGMNITIPGYTANTQT